jgi:hypothetical protein
LIAVEVLVKLVFLEGWFFSGKFNKDNVQLFSMNRNLCLTLSSLLILFNVFSATVSADVSVGVKQGDWIEYNVSFTGNPPVEHDVVWARMEVNGVEGKRVNATFTSQLSNGSMLDVVENLDFEAGRLIDLFIIPANLNAGDKFHDNAVGNVAIDGVEVRTYAGAARAVVHAEAVDTQWYWDKSTGVAVEARTTTSMYTLDTIASDTSLWSPQVLGLDSTVFYVLVVAVTFAVVVAATVLVFRRKRS